MVVIKNKKKALHWDLRVTSTFSHIIIWMTETTLKCIWAVNIGIPILNVRKLRLRENHWFVPCYRASMNTCVFLLNSWMIHENEYGFWNHPDLCLNSSHTSDKFLNSVSDICLEFLLMDLILSNSEICCT